MRADELVVVDAQDERRLRNRDAGRAAGFQDVAGQQVARGENADFYKGLLAKYEKNNTMGV